MKRTQPQLCVIALLFTAAMALSPAQAQADGRGQVHFVSRFGRNTAIVDSKDPYWQNAYREVDRKPEDIADQDQREKKLGLYFPKLIRGDQREKILALTFDDGPHPGYTERLLAILRAEHVKATFFVVGKMVERNPELVRQILADGNVLGDHTFSHVTLTKIPENQVRAEYEACNDIVESITGQRMRYCRPPGGDYDRAVIKAAADQGLTTVLWTDDPGDYAKPGTNTIEKKTLRRLSNGGIILLHDGIEQTINVLPQIIDYARDHGYRFVTMDQLQSSLVDEVKAPAARLADYPKPNSPDRRKITALQQWSQLRRNR